MLKIKEAIAHHNRNHLPTLTQKDLARMVMPDKSEGTAQKYLSDWATGKGYSSLKPEHIKKICDICKIDPNYLFGIK